MPAGAYAFGAGHPHAPARPRAQRDRDRLLPVLQGRRDRRERVGGADRDPVQPADHGRDARQLAGGGVLVRVRADARAVRARRARVLGPHRPAQGARRGAVRGDGDVARDRRDLRRRRRARDPRRRRAPTGSSPCAARSGGARRSAAWPRCSPRSGPSRSIATFGYTANMRYQKLTSYVVVPLRRRVPVGVPAGRASAWCSGSCSATAPRSSWRRSPVIFALVFRLWPELHAWNLRFLPFWYLGVFLLAAIGAAEIVRRLSGEFGRLWVGPPASPDAAYDADADAHRPHVPRRHVDHDHRDRRGARDRRAVVQPEPAGLPRLLGEVERDGVRERGAPGRPQLQGRGAQAVPRVPRAHRPHGRAAAGPRAVGGRRLDRRLRHAARVDAAAVLDPRSDPELRGSLLRVGREHAVRVHGDRAAVGVGQRVEPGARPRLPLDRELLRRRALPARARRSLLPRALAGGEGRGEPPIPGLRLVGTSPDVDHQAPEGWSIYEVRDHALVAPLSVRAGRRRAPCRYAARLLRWSGRHRPGPRARRLGVRGRRVVVEAGEPGPTARRVRARVVEACATAKARADVARRRLPAGAGDRRPPDRRRHPVPRVAHRRAGGRAHVVLPELGGARARTVRGGSART